MTVPPTTMDAVPESQAWQELEDVVARLAQLARSAVEPAEFYRTVLHESVRAMAAVGGTVWLRAGSGAMQPVVQINRAASAVANDDDARCKHERLLAEAAAEGRIRTVAEAGGDPSANDHVLLLGPVQAGSTPAGDRDAPPATRAIIELVLQRDASPAMYRGSEQFLAAVCEVAADYHTFEELRNLRQNEDYRLQLLALSRAVHRDLKLSETAYAVANEGRRLIGCGRLNVLAARGRRCRLLATSGASRVERRSGAARRLEKLANLVCRTDEPAYLADGECDALPPVADALERHAEESHARQVAAIPLREPRLPYEEEDRGATRRRRRPARPRFVLIAEQFDARDGELSRERLVEVGEVCTTALYNALEFDRLPLAWLLRPLGAVKQQLAVQLPRTLFVAAAVAAAVAALIYIPADFNIEATGSLQPTVKRDVFAPRRGLVDEVLVAHGADVQPGQPLVRLRDPSLELELKRLDGELETTQRQVEAVRAMRTNRAVREVNPADAFRLSAEERELEQKLANLRRERELLSAEREQLVVNSPIAGRIVTWDIGHRLTARPVERGEVLVTVADLSSEWQLELDVPDDRIGYVFAAQRDDRPQLPVRFRLSSDDRERHTGHIAEIGQVVDVSHAEGVAPAATVLIKVELDSLELSDGARRELRPGVTARAQIACGRRPLGYVWLHDVWDAVLEWLNF